MGFKNKVALVTGGSRGMGRAMALAFAREGAKVVILATNQVRGSSVIEEIIKEEGKALFVQANVSKKQEARQAIAIAEKNFGPVDILVNNAGIHDGSPFLEETEQVWEKLFRVNVLGTVIPSQVVIPGMMKRKKGKIVNISSKAAVVGEPYHTAYSASKGAVLALTRALAMELAPFNITVNAVCPGPTYTDMLLQATDQTARDKLVQSTPLGRLGKPEDIVGAVLYLASEESDWCTGQAISLDGGLSILK